MIRLDFDPIQFTASTVAWLLVCLIPLGALFGLVGYALSLPMRRQERARFFLDLLETGLRQGRSAEQTIISLAQTREPSVGARFHWLATQLESGVQLSAALEKMNGWLPPQLVAMLRAGETIGDLRRVLPAGRQLLNDGLPQLTKVQNYLLLLPFLATPVVLLLIVPLFAARLFPMMVSVLQDMDAPTPMLFRLLFRHSSLVFAIGALILGLSFLLSLGSICYVGGSRFMMWALAGLPRFGDRLFLLVPWKRRRMQRDFCAMLGLLLDANVPEAEAVRLAAACTFNRVLLQRAEAAVGELSRGVVLAEALRRLDDAGEFRWRLATASRGQGSFWSALTAWREALEAKAFQQEQTFAQVATTVLVLGNGLLVGGLAVAIFQPLIAVVQTVALW